MYVGLEPESQKKTSLSWSLSTTHTYSHIRVNVHTYVHSHIYYNSHSSMKRTIFMTKGGMNYTTVRLSIASYEPPVLLVLPLLKPLPLRDT